MSFAIINKKRNELWFAIIYNEEKQFAVHQHK